MQQMFTWIWLAFGVITLGAIAYGSLRNVSRLYWKVLICLVPIVASAIIVSRSTAQYNAGEGGFKLGVDLVGGTILVYEIDPDKLPKDQKYNPQEMAAALKRRIDPNDLYNVTIRPVGDTRVEIILPTGGAHQANLAEASWNEVLDKVNERFKTELGGERVKVDRGQPGALKKKVHDEIEARQWAKLIAALSDQYPKLKEQKDLKLDEIRGQTQELIKKIQGPTGVGEDELKKFVEANFKPTDYETIGKFVDEVYSPSQRRKDVTGEEVQKIKDSIARVGSLEFRILANEVDDREIFDAVQTMYKDALSKPDMKEKLERAAATGDAPPLPESPTGDWALGPQENREQTRSRYAWVELGRKMRFELGLDNAAQSGDKDRRHHLWPQVAQARAKGDVLLLSEFGHALLYSRKCENIKLSAEERTEKANEYFILTRLPEKDETGTELSVTGQDLIYAQDGGIDEKTGKRQVNFAFNNRGANRFQRLTSQNTPGSGNNPFHRNLAVLLDGYVESSAQLITAIRESGRITGDFTTEEVERLVRVLRSGALPATLKPRPVSENTIGPTLGEDTIKSGLRAIVWAFVAVLVFMCIYYRFSGFVASSALLANLLMTIAFMVFVNATFTLPGLAGLVLTLGMAVDANVLIYERLREERDRGANLVLALRNGYDRALPTIIDTHLSSIFTAIVLYVVGNDQLKGFGVSLTAGLVISLFTSLFMTRTIFDLWMKLGLLKKLGMFRFFSRPNIDFMRIRYYWFTATILLTVFGLGVFLKRGPAGLNIDFVGGTAYGGVLRPDAATDMEGLRNLFDDKQQSELLKVANVKEVGDDELTYAVTYLEPQETVTVVLSNKPKGATREEREADVKERAGRLPDWSVEQLFVSKDETSREGKSRYFTVRTTEREPDLVQVVVDRLLRQKTDGQIVRLQQSTSLDVDKIQGTQALLRFSTLSSPGYVKILLEREVANMGVKDVALNLVGTDPNAEQGRHTTMTAEFGSDLLKSLAEMRLRHAAEAVKKKLGATLAEVKGNQFKFEFSTPQSLDAIKAAVEAELKGPGLAKPEAKVKGEGDAKDGKFAAATVDLTPETAKALNETIIGVIVGKTKEEFAKRPQPERLENFDGQLAADTQRMAMWAIIASWVAILLYLWFRFGSWTFGAAAVLCLIHDLFFTIGMIAFAHYLVTLWPGFFHGILKLEDFKIDLPAVAALLTLVGYSVNDTIVVFDRIREVRGKNPLLTAQMINDSINQTLSRTILASTTVFLVVLVLYWIGGEGVHLFAFVMVIGVIVGTYSSIYIASPLLLIFGEGTPPKKPVAVQRPAPTGAAV
jgi:SecD/SecF fusion protein